MQFINVQITFRKLSDGLYYIPQMIYKCKHYYFTVSAQLRFASAL